MEEQRPVSRGEKAPVETATANPGESRDTGSAGPKADRETRAAETPEGDEDPDSVRLASDVAAEREAARQAELAARPRRSRGAKGRGRRGTRARGSETR